MMSGSASAHLPIIIRLSSVAVFSAPLTDSAANRRGKTYRTDFSATFCGCFLFFFSLKPTNQYNFFSPLSSQ